MSRMTESQRMQFDRPELGHSSSDKLLGARSQAGPLTYTLIMLPILAAGLYAALAGIDEWWQGVVLGVIVLTAIGLMIAVSPTRRA